MVKPILVGHFAPELSYILPANAETSALIMPPGSMIIPVRATATSNPFCKYCGNKYIADKIIPKSIITSTAPKVKFRCSNTRILSTGTVSFN